ncbi:MAG: SCO family protein [Isosphaeraceae bacterium]
MNRSRRAPHRIALAGLGLGLAAILAAPSAADDRPGESVPLAEAAGMVDSPIRKIDFEQKLDAAIPLDVRFRDESGREVMLADYFGEKPVILTLSYFRCPLICTQELNGLARSLRPVSLEYAKDFRVITVSIDPSEKPPLAADKKKGILKKFPRKGAEEGWHFLTGDEASIRRLADAVGFKYTYNESKAQYLHSAGLVVLTPQGRIARYYYGIDYPSRDLQFSLIDASAGKIGSPVHKILMFCYDYDPTTGRYTLAVTYLMRALAAGTAVALGTYIAVMLVRERRRRLPPVPIAHPTH